MLLFDLDEEACDILCFFDVDFVDCDGEICSGGFLFEGFDEGARFVFAGGVGESEVDTLGGEFAGAG